VHSSHTQRGCLKSQWQEGKEPLSSISPSTGSWDHWGVRGVGSGRHGRGEGVDQGFACFTIYECGEIDMLCWGWEAAFQNIVEESHIGRGEGASLDVGVQLIWQAESRD